MSSEKEMEIKRFMAQMLAEGETLSNVQKLVNEKFGTKMTFMDIRILASELENIDWSAHDPKAPKKEEPEDNGSDEKPLEPEQEAVPGDGRTVVEISKLVRPGTALSGSVTFRSGSTADWYVDSYGRLGIENLKGDKPSEADIQDFQIELQKMLGR